MNYMASNIKHLREHNGWTQEELGKKIGLAKSTIACYETGSRTPNIAKISKLCDLFHVSTDDLVNKDLSTIDTAVYADWIKAELLKNKLTDADFDNLGRFIHAYFRMNDNQRNKLISMIESMVE